MTLADPIKQEALDLGFDLVGITDASPIDSSQVRIFTDWLKAGYAAGLTYMHNNLAKRIDPGQLLPVAQSVICVGLNYKPCNNSNLQRIAGTGRVSNYAQYEDYHLFIKRQLRKLVEFIFSVSGPAIRFKICVDSAPLTERSLAVRAGLGFIGANHMLANPDFGSQIFLGEIVTNLKLDIDTPHTGKCPDCRKCINACPTGALRDDGFFDAGKCISYLTIEHKGDIPAELAKKIGDRLFGCDDCVLACPHTQKAPACANAGLKAYPDRAALNLSEIIRLDEKAFDRTFADTPIRRLGLEMLKRNAGICLDNQ